MEELSLEELMLLNESLDYTNTVYQNQLKLLDDLLSNKIITSLEYLKSHKSLLAKMRFIKKQFIINKLMFDKKEERSEFVSWYLE